MTDWVHCNTCFRQPGSGPKFALTNCGHIYCSDCLEAGTKEKCRMCGNACTSITLSAKMKPDVELYFTDPVALFKKQQHQLVMVLEFQKNHRQRLTAHRRDVQTKHVALLESAKGKMREMETDINRLREENRKLRGLISGSPGPSSAGMLMPRQVTPGRGMRNSPASSTSSSNRMVHQTPSPSKRGSPYGRPSYPTTPMEMSKGSLQSPHTVTPGPQRLSIRTPPSGGRMGKIVTPNWCPSTVPLTPRASATRQGGTTPSGTQSPMSMGDSPQSYHQRATFSMQERRHTPGHSGDSHGRKQIQLQYTPHSRPSDLSSAAKGISASQP